jgi:hypothetical protein
MLTGVSWAHCGVGSGFHRAALMGISPLGPGHFQTQTAAPPICAANSMDPIDEYENFKPFPPLEGDVQ